LGHYYEETRPGTKETRATGACVKGVARENGRTATCGGDSRGGDSNPGLDDATLKMPAEKGQPAFPKEQRKKRKNKGRARRNSRPFAAYGGVKRQQKKGRENKMVHRQATLEGRIARSRLVQLEPGKWKGSSDKATKGTATDGYNKSLGHVSKAIIRRALQTENRAGGKEG